MLKSLVLSRFQGMFYRKPKDGKKKSNPYAIVIAALLYLVFVFGTMFFGTNSMLYDAFAGLLGAENVYFGMAAFTSMLLGFVGSVSMTQAQIYMAKDNELLLSMPIKPSLILLSRIIVLYAWAWAFSAMNFIPAMMVYFLSSENITVAGSIFLVLELFLVPLFALTASIIFAWLLQLLTSRMKNKNIVTIIGTMIFFCAYMAFCLKLQNLVMLVTANGESIIAAMHSYLYPFLLCGDAVTNTSILSVLGMLISTICPFAIAYFVLTKTFIKIITTKAGVVKTKYVAGKIKEKSPRHAIAVKELERFIATPSFVVSELTCMIMQIAGAGYIAIKGGDIVTMISSMVEGGISPSLVATVAIMAVSAIGAIAGLTIVTISLEGKSLWILQATPIETIDILLGKLYAHLYVSVPFGLLIGIALLFVPGANALERIFALILPVVVHIFTGYFGLAVNLKYPKLDWTSESQALKQSGAAYIAAFSGMGFIPLMGGLPMLLSKYIPSDVVLVSATLLLIIGCVLYHFYLKGKGSKRFDELRG